MLDSSFAYTGAFMAGMFSFFSPCMLPLFPSYATYLSGAANSTSPGNIQGTLKRWQVFKHALLFIGGFTVIFILLGATASGAGQFITANRREMIIVSGAFLVVFGLNLIGVFRPQFLLREYRFPQVAASLPKSLLSLMTGMGFGLAWTPCIGPYLGSILALAASADSMQTGMQMLAAYSGGLGIPFLLGAAGMEWIFRKISQRRKMLFRLQLISGIVLIVLGLFLISGLYGQITQSIIRIVNNL